MKLYVSPNSKETPIAVLQNRFTYIRFLRRLVGLDKERGFETRKRSGFSSVVRLGNAP